MHRKTSTRHTRHRYPRTALGRWRPRRRHRCLAGRRVPTLVKYPTDLDVSPGTRDVQPPHRPSTAPLAEPVVMP
jgi:hypothetical protein